MTEGLPLTHPYNLARLGQAGDKVSFSATPEERAALAHWSGVASVDAFSVRADIRKLSPGRFALDMILSADLVQSCVVTLEPVRAYIERRFTRELHFTAPARRTPKSVPTATISILDVEDEEPPEEIDSLIYDLARPVLEEYILSLDPYPRADGAQFGVKSASENRPDSPFSALKSFKSGS